jgi:outer membrane protein OmpA-like peptidoglycan-associated protein
MTVKRSVLLGTLACLVPMWVAADVVVLREGASAEDVGRALAGEAALPADLDGELPPGLLPDSIQPGTAGPTFRGVASGPAICPPSRRRVSMEISFDRGSAKLTDAAQKALNKIAEAMSGPKLRPCRFTIVGHTDAKGSDQANQKLSVARAESVKGYLALRSVNEMRLLTQGMGESEPLNPKDPEAAENRRVEFYIEP